MNNIIKSLAITGLLLLASASFAQTILSTTTLSSASYKGIRAQTVTVGSISNIVVGSDLYIDQELMQVEGTLPTTGTTIQVIRGYGGTQAQYHNSGALVFIVPAAAQPYALVTADPQGACTRGQAALSGGLTNSASTLYLPVINQLTGRVFDCLGNTFVGGWPTGSLNALAQFEVPFPNGGGTAYTSLGSATTTAAGTLYCVEADLQENKYLTGIAIMNGGTVGTDKHLVALLDSQGNILANSALGGTADATANVYQKYPFTSTYYAVGPAQYYACVQSNGTTDNIRMVVTGTQDTYLTTSKTGTFGTIPTITVPTGFTTAVGPYSFFY